ncbi:MAG: cobyric acid synthase [Candidatus Omnitrophota bacterium]|nr:cobyric acid synthase [Candidatus Omnitrophota bacterium]
MRPPKAKAIQICGTGSGVGKSVITAGLCRIFAQEGFKVAPFKAQNMSLNSAVTPEGLEIGRAQAMQAAACGIEARVDMNPVLLKPTGNTNSQVIVHGKPVGNMSAVKYYGYKKKILGAVKQSLKNLVNSNDIVVIEGAGSPAEINLKSHDIVNMRIAKFLKCPVLLVGDIDRGGVFAWLHGTLDLLTPCEKDLIKGIIINKFRGDKNLLSGGIRFLERKTGKKVLGIVPYYQDIKLPEEDSLFFDQKREAKIKKDAIKIAVIRLPRISNFTDFDAFEQEPGVELKYSRDANEIKESHCVIIPGSKNTCADLKFLISSGLAEVICRKAKRGDLIVGICGGYQMLGRSITDSHGVENRARTSGLKLLDISTTFGVEKDTHKINAKEIKTGLLLEGYEIHHGQTKVAEEPLFVITRRSDKNVYIKDGAVNGRGNVWGTYIHGIFDNYSFRKRFLSELKQKSGLKLKLACHNFSLDKEFDKLAGLLRENLDFAYIKEVIGV